MSAEGELSRKQRTLKDIEEELKDVHRKRTRRRANEVEGNRDETRRKKLDLVKLQEEAHDDLERLEKLLKRLTDEDPTNDPPDRTEKYLIAEIDLLEREIDRRGPHIEKVRNRQESQTERFRKLDDKAKARAERQQKLKKRKRRVLDQIERIKKRLQARPNWPSSLSVAELMYHDPPHCHLASGERGKLIEIGKLAEAEGLRVGEFPPFDDVECVHTGSSWHYRVAGGGSVLICSSTRLNLGGDAGCAIDFNDADGGSDKEVAIYHELVERY